MDHCCVPNYLSQEIKAHELAGGNVEVNELKNIIDNFAPDNMTYHCEVPNAAIEISSHNSNDIDIDKVIESINPDFTTNISDMVTFAECYNVLPNDHIVDNDSTNNDNNIASEMDSKVITNTTADITDINDISLDPYDIIPANDPNDANLGREINNITVDIQKVEENITPDFSPDIKSISIDANFMILPNDQISANNTANEINNNLIEETQEVEENITPDIFLSANFIILPNDHILVTNNVKIDSAPIINHISTYANLDDVVKSTILNYNVGDEVKLPNVITTVEDDFEPNICDMILDAGSSIDYNHNTVYDKDNNTLTEYVETNCNGFPDEFTLNINTGNELDINKINTVEVNWLNVSDISPNVKLNELQNDTILEQDILNEMDTHIVIDNVIVDFETDMNDIIPNGDYNTNNNILSDNTPDLHLETDSLEDNLREVPTDIMDFLTHYDTVPNNIASDEASNIDIYEDRNMNADLTPDIIDTLLNDISDQANEINVHKITDIITEMTPYGSDVLANSKNIPLNDNNVFHYIDSEVVYNAMEDIVPDMSDLLLLTPKDNLSAITTSQTNVTNNTDDIPDVSTSDLLPPNYYSNLKNTQVIILPNNYILIDSTPNEEEFCTTTDTVREDSAPISDTLTCVNHVNGTGKGWDLNPNTANEIHNVSDTILPNATYNNLQNDILAYNVPNLIDIGKIPNNMTTDDDYMLPNDGYIMLPNHDIQNTLDVTDMIEGGPIIGYNILPENTFYVVMTDNSISEQNSENAFDTNNITVNTTSISEQSTESGIDMTVNTISENNIEKGIDTTKIIDYNISKEHSENVIDTNQIIDCTILDQNTVNGIDMTVSNKKTDYIQAESMPTSGTKPNIEYNILPNNIITYSGVNEIKNQATYSQAEATNMIPNFTYNHNISDHNKIVEFDKSTESDIITDFTPNMCFVVYNANFNDQVSVKNQPASTNQANIEENNSKSFISTPNTEEPADKVLDTTKVKPKIKFETIPKMIKVPERINKILKSKEPPIMKSTRINMIKDPFMLKRKCYLKGRNKRRKDLRRILKRSIAKIDRSKLIRVVPKRRTEYTTEPAETESPNIVEEEEYIAAKIQKPVYIFHTAPKRKLEPHQETVASKISKNYNSLEDESFNMESNFVLLTEEPMDIPDVENERDPLLLDDEIEDCNKNKKKPLKSIRKTFVKISYSAKPIIDGNPTISSKHHSDETDKDLNKASKKPKFEPKPQKNPDPLYVEEEQGTETGYFEKLTRSSDNTNETSIKVFEQDKVDTIVSSGNKMDILDVPAVDNKPNGNDYTHRRIIEIKPLKQKDENDNFKVGSFTMRRM